MSLNCGIVGLPNVGKSTLFNALTATQAAESANYPFCTIEPNVGRVAVPDIRLQQLSSIARPLKEIGAQLEFVDIAGLVKGASKGEGLGNQFLANIREVDAILHVLRCFEDDNVTHVENSINPCRDAETVELELMIADLESLEKRIVAAEKKAKGGDKEAKVSVDVMQAAMVLLKDSKPASLYKPKNIDEEKTFKQLYLLSAKPVLYVCNVGEGEAATGNALTQSVFDKAAKEGKKAVIISSKIEAEISQLPEADQKEFLETLGLSEKGLNRLIRASYDLLHLQTYFTAGEKEVHAWTIRKGMTAPEAAGVIHTDFEKGFIRAEVISFDDYVKYKGESGARDAGRLRSEGKSYIMQDGDVCHFLFNV